MNSSLKYLQGVATSLVVFWVLALLAYFIAPIIKPVEESGLDTSSQSVGIHLLFTLIGAVLILALCYFTREHPAWQVTSREVVYMAIGATLYGAFVWLFNGTTFNLPAVSQVSLRPAVVLPVFFGFTFGPMVGLMSGAVGNLIGDLFTGVVYPQWDLANGIIGLCAGLAVVFADRKQSLNVATALTALGGVAAPIFFFANPTLQFFPPPDFAPTKLSFFMGVSVAVGAALAILVRFAFPNRPSWALAALWGAVGNIVGLGLASISDIWINGYTMAQVVAGELIPTVGPNLIAVAILMPVLLVVYHSAQQQSEAG